MVAKTCVVIVACVGLFVAIQTLFPKALALKRSSAVDEYMVEDKRTRMRQNYVVQRALDNDYVNDMEYIGPKYTVDALQRKARPGAEPLSDLIVDYANMIRNDVILLDNSVQTRTRKTGNIKVKKQNQAFPDVPCKCENSSESINLTKDWGVVYPYMVRNLTCSDVCVEPYTCQRKIYNITVLKRRPETLTLSSDDISKLNRGYDMPLPSELVRRWTPKTIPIITGCYCTLA